MESTGPLININHQNDDLLLEKLNVNVDKISHKWTKEEEDDFILNKVKEGLKYNSIAELLGKKTSTVCSRIKLIASKLLLEKNINEVCKITGLSNNQVLVLQNKLNSRNNSDLCIDKPNPKLDIRQTNVSSDNTHFSINYKGKNSQTDAIFNNIKEKFGEIPESNIFDSKNKYTSIEILKNISIQLDILINILSKQE